MEERENWMLSRSGHKTVDGQLVAHLCAYLLMCKVHMVPQCRSVTPFRNTVGGGDEEVSTDSRPLGRT